MNIFNYFWLKNPHPDIRFALISYTYEETADQDMSDCQSLQSIVVSYYKGREKS